MKNKKNILENRKTRDLVILFMLLLFCFVFIIVNYTNVINAVNIGNQRRQNENDMEIIIGGEAVGIKLLATGVLIMSVDRYDTKLEVGDIILKVNNNKIESNAELEEYIKASNGNALNLEVIRKDEVFQIQITPIFDELSNKYKLGLWVKDSSAGVGTITFYDRKSKRFAALGHAVTEIDENYILPITSGAITNTDIYSIKKGINNIPGELKGTITAEAIGEITHNTHRGIYGMMYKEDIFKNKKKVAIVSKSNIKEGKAYIHAYLDENTYELYEIIIEKVLLNSNGNKNMVIKVTDQRLIDKTGGIIQGMSGSPIVQDGKLIGAVTHVFLNNPLRGYAVFIENMIVDIIKDE